MKRLIAVAILLLSACQTAPSQESSAEKKPVVAEIKKFAKEELYGKIIFAGTVKAKQETHLYAPLAGTVEQQFVEEGESVEKGRKILSIRPDSRGLEFQPNVLKAAVSGTLISVEREATEHVNANEEIATIADLSQLVVDIHASQSDLPFLHVGNELLVVVAGEETVGKILRIAQRADRESRAFPVRIALQADPSIRLGAFARITAKKNLRQGIRVPLSYLQRSQTALIVLDRQDQAHWTDVKVGQVFGDKIEILEGIDENSRVIGGFSRQPEEGEQIHAAEQE
jgi:multidrug efflux pump subunit AcrA (membrane-fusion protein)